MATPHISAKKEQIAKIVLMAGDPLRAKLFAETYLTTYEQVNKVRGMLAYTGLLNNTRVTVMGHGMGLESIGIYAYELFKFYDVKVIIRFGSAGAYDKKLNLLDIVIADKAYSKSNYGEGFGFNKDTMAASPKLLEIINESVKEISFKHKVINSTCNSSMWFYKTHDIDVPEEFVKKGISCAEMEAYALYAIARSLNKEAITILTISDHIAKKDQVLSADERLSSFTEAFELLKVAVKKIDETLG